jgi:hypothetical protein
MQLSPKYNHNNKDFHIGRRDALKPQRRKRGRFNIVVLMLAIGMLARGMA